jgi:hypothetical protein
MGASGAGKTIFFQGEFQISKERYLLMISHLASKILEISQTT